MFYDPLAGFSSEPSIVSQNNALENLDGKNKETDQIFERDRGDCKRRDNGVPMAKTKIRRAAGVILAIVLLACYLADKPASAANKPGAPPIYNSASKSYFQLFELPLAHQNNWLFVRRAANSKSFKGVRGRLAVVGNDETHQFILQNFDLSEEIWIGLRYWCNYRMLKWNGEAPYSPSDPGRFSAWHAQWYRTADIVCPAHEKGEMAFMGVYYRPTGKGAARWQASGPRKAFRRFLVEFPTGSQ